MSKAVLKDKKLTDIILDTIEGKNLSTVYNCTGVDLFIKLHDDISAGNFDNINVGDYFTFDLEDASEDGTAYSDVVSAKSQSFTVAHIDPYYKSTDQSKAHHVAFVSTTPIATAGDWVTSSGSYLLWNTTNTNQGTADEPAPYLCSNLKDWEDKYESLLPATLQSYLLEQRVLLESRYSASGNLTDSNTWAWKDIGKVWSLSETEVYGQCVWGTKGFSIGFDCHFDYFKDTAHRSPFRVDWWLRSVRSGSASLVCLCDRGGRADCDGATRTWVRPRPGFLLG